MKYILEYDRSDFYSPRQWAFESDKTAEELYSELKDCLSNKRNFFGKELIGFFCNYGICTVEEYWADLPRLH